MNKEDFSNEIVNEVNGLVELLQVRCYPVEEFTRGFGCTKSEKQNVVLILQSISKLFQLFRTTVTDEFCFWRQDFLSLVFFWIQ